MEPESSTTPLDPALEPYVRAPNVIEEEASLAVLIGRAGETARSILVSKGYTPDEQDHLVSNVLFKVIRRLQQMRRDPRAFAITNFSGYAAVVTYNAHHAHLREQNPERQRLRNRIRYVLRTSKHYGLWDSENGEALAGFARWRKEGRAAVRPGWEPPSAPLTAVVAAVDNLTPPMLTRVLTHVFESASAPVELERLTDVVASALHLSVGRDRRQGIEDIDVADERPSAEKMLVDKTLLAQLWAEIIELPPRQRAALLLNLRDPSGSGVLSLLIIVGIASIEKVASALEMTEEELAAMWDQLPLDDLTIAARFGIERQQVINLRKSARERLARRLRTPTRTR